MSAQGEVLVDIRGLTMEYVSKGGFLGRAPRRIRVLEDLNLQIYRGETLGVVGESGCGKTTLANCVARFVRPSSGEIIFGGRDILSLDPASLRDVRSEMQMVFQNPFNSLNPRMNVMGLVDEPLRTHTTLGGQAMQARVLDLLKEVGLGEEHLGRHPHELSGGQAQRVALARALALNPKLLLLDEPTSALDVSVQAQIVNLLETLQHEHGLTYMFISHGLGVVQHISDRIAVLYLGEVVELAPRDRIFEAPAHPYTQALFSSTPIPDPDRSKERIALEGNVPSPADPPTGCRFHTRCPYVMNVCRQAPPGKYKIDEGHWATCYLLAE